MNEVTKLYENAESDRDCNLYKHFTECPMKHTQCEDCENFVYPPFTPEKQLELIKLFAKREVYINSQENKYYIFTMNIGGSAFGENLENALARYINKFWQDLTDAEKAEIKNILESEVRE